MHQSISRHDVREEAGTPLPASVDPPAPQPKIRPRTHCLRGHEFTPENTQWINVPVTDANGARVQRSRLCRICSRARVRRYLDKKGGRTPVRSQPLPPLPEDLYELELERVIRRILRSRLHRRAPDFWREAESRLEHHAFQVESSPHRVPIRKLALHKESWSAYAVRTDAGEDDHGDWFVNRMLDDPRIRTMLGNARSKYIIVEPADYAADAARARAIRRRRQSVPPGVRTLRPARRGRAAAQP
jgi:hypothetical protein